MVVNDKEKESVFNEPRDDKPTDSGSSHKKRDGKKKRRIKNIIYYDSDASSSSPHDDNNDSLSKKKTVVGGLTCFPSIICYYRDLRTWYGTVHNEESAVWEKVEPVPKLLVKMLRLSD
jgi:hypothetical protein